MPAPSPRLAVVGAGTWGTTLAILLSRSAPVVLLARDDAHARTLARDGENRHYLPGVRLGERVHVCADESALGDASEMVILAVPSWTMRSTAARIAPALAGTPVLVSVAKGIEDGSLLRMSQVVAEVIPDAADRVAALSGPNLALEVSRGLPAASVIAAVDDQVGRRVTEILGGRTFRLYRNRDIVGVELAGALKNIVAIVAGAVDALEAGDNAKAAITTRGLAEITRLGVAMGANPLTFAGLAGIGDILATASSSLSRNHRLGVELAAGRPWSEIEGSLPGVAEGAYTVRAAVALAARHGVEMPIAEEVNAVLYEGKDVRASVTDLLSRTSKDELTGLD
jgi:glycerol-3-phosphate dehydrogenase (NAD(P)+)